MVSGRVRSALGLLSLVLLGCATTAQAVHRAAPETLDAPARAEASAPAVAPEGSPALPDSAPRSWLYRVTTPGAEPSYLLGTMHVGVAFPRAVPAPLDAAMLSARTVVMEIDLREAERFLRDPPRRHRTRLVPIDRALPRETWARLTAELSYIATPAQIADVPAGALAVYMRQVRMAEVEAEDDGWDRVPGTASPTHLDRWIFDWAMDAGVPFVALETPEETVAALSTFPRPSAIEALRQVIDHPDVARDAARRLRDAYLSLDDERVLAILAELSNEERQATFDRRNEAWLARLVPTLEAGGAFVAVGLAHLLGERSLVALLRERGFGVERVLGDGGLTRTEGADAWLWAHARPRTY